MILIEYGLEYIALFDFITDLIIAIELVYSKHAMWAAFTINAMIAPVIVCLSQMISFLLENVIRRNRKQSNLILMTTSWASIGPLFVIFMILMDLVFIIN